MVTITKSFTAKNSKELDKIANEYFFTVSDNFKIRTIQQQVYKEGKDITMTCVFVVEEDTAAFAINEKTIKFFTEE